MKSFLKSLLGTADDNSRGESDDYDIQVATAALFLEVARADFDFTDEERREVMHALKNSFSLSDEEVEELIAVSERELDRRVDVYFFTKQINGHFDRAEKLKIVENFWRVIYTDRRLDGHEDAVVHRLSRLFGLDHHELIAAKVKVKGRLPGPPD